MIGPDQQFISLSDFRGEEIYEGDILRVERKGLAGFGTYIPVVRSKEEAGFIEDYNGGVISKASIDSGQLRVVGNIYEYEAKEGS